jgi:hypothetical protein
MSKINIQQQTIEEALSMYTETVSPSKNILINILNQIPEKELVQAVPRRVTRSPYIWIAALNIAIVSSFVIVLYPTFEKTIHERNDPFYQVDQEVTQFETSIDNEDAQIVVDDYAL